MIFELTVKVTIAMMFDLIYEGRSSFSSWLDWLRRM